MALPYLPQGAVPDIQVLPSGDVEDVQVVSGITIGHGVYYAGPVNLGTWARDQGQAFLTAVGGAIEAIASHANVAGLVYQQDLDPTGLIRSYMNVTITVPAIQNGTGPWATTIQVPVQLLSTPFSNWEAIVYPQIDAAVATLTAARDAT